MHIKLLQSSNVRKIFNLKIIIVSLFLILSATAPSLIFGSEIQKNNTNKKELSIELSSFKLEQNYPNPFNPTTQITYSIPVESHVILKVYNVLGNEITTLVDEEKPAGEYSIKFNASDLSSGVYIYRLQTDYSIITKKMTLLK
ncbi:MAG: T9SS type A sorting domain-containing protein [Candidatus Thorarchaeota archaeon]